MLNQDDDNEGFIPLGIAVMTVSDTRTLNTDQSGALLVQLIEEAGHQAAERSIVKDDRGHIESQLYQWLDDSQIQVIIATGGTGVTARDITPEAFQELYDKEIPGFGELFRWVSFQKIGTSTIQSRATGGVARGKYLFSLPGSQNAVQDAWDNILKPQFDARTKPCNFVELIGRLR